MRTAKYNDYTLLRILLFIILVILGIFAYKHFVKAPCEHTAAGNEWVTVEATCTEDGYRYKICTECGEQFGNESLAATGHKIDDIVIEIEAATCTKTGTGYKACSVCGEHLESVVIPTVEHIGGEEVTENEKEHTATQGASYEKVVYCTECDGELSREKVDVEHKVTVSVNKIADPTCTKNGAEQTVVYCNDCEKALSTENKDIDPIGHQFVWELVYADGEFVPVGKCTATECGHEYDEDVDTAYTYDVIKDETNSVNPTCGGGFDSRIAIIYHNGVEVSRATIRIKLDADKTIEHTILNENGEAVNISEYVLYDENGVAYFNISTPGIILVYEREEGQTITEAQAAVWDENGFALGIYKCASVNGELEHWVTVRVYNDLAENDSVEDELA